MVEESELRDSLGSRVGWRWRLRRTSHVAVGGRAELGGVDDCEKADQSSEEERGGVEQERSEKIAACGMG